MDNREHPAQRSRVGLKLMGAFEPAQAGALHEILGVMLVPRQAKRERPQARQHFGKHAW